MKVFLRVVTGRQMVARPRKGQGAAKDSGCIPVSDASIPPPHTLGNLIYGPNFSVGVSERRSAGHALRVRAHYEELVGIWEH